MDTAANAFGAVDILVNNAGNAGPLNGIGDLAPFWETGPELMGPWLDTNLYGVLNCTRAVLPSMVESGSGRVVSVISDAGRVGEPDLADTRPPRLASPVSRAPSQRRWVGTG